MILLWGLEEDDPMKMVHAELVRAGANVFYLDHRDILNCDIETIFDGHQMNTILHNGDRSLDLATIRSAYCRPYNFRDYDEFKDKTDDDPSIIKAAGFEMQLSAHLDTAAIFYINRSGPSATNNSKPLQLSLIRNAGLKAPETLLTNDPGEARSFLKKHRNIIFKSISGQRSIVEKISADDSESLDDVKWCLTLFQEAIPGTNYRVHVLGDQLFTVRIESDRLDYRYGNTTMKVEQLPADLAEKCIRLTADIGLNLAGIDLMRTPDDKWYCFEVNPSPAYSYFQHHSGLPIAQAVAQALMNADK